MGLGAGRVSASTEDPPMLSTVRLRDAERSAAVMERSVARADAACAALCMVRRAAMCTLAAVAVSSMASAVGKRRPSEARVAFSSKDETSPAAVKLKDTTER